MDGLSDKFKVFLELIEKFWTSVFDVKAVIAILVGIATLVLQVRLEYKRTSRDKKKGKGYRIGACGYRAKNKV